MNDCPGTVFVVLAFAVAFSMVLTQGCVPRAKEGPLALYVSPGGSDEATGRSARDAFATLVRARDEIRKLKAAGQLPRGATVNVLAGLYPLAEAFALSADDSGTLEAPIVYQGVGRDKPRLVGGKPLTGFKPFRDQILQCDLKANGLAGHRFDQLFFNGRRMTLARYPNVDATDIHGGRWAHVAMVEGAENHREFFYDSDEKHTWAHPEEGRVHLFGGYDWAFNITPIAKHVPEQRKIVLKGNSWGPLRIGDRYILDGLFEELDAPGEWYLDPRTDTLYFWPPDDIAKGEVVAPLADGIVVLDGADHVTVRGFAIECCRGDGVRIANCRGSLVAGCDVTNCGGWGIAVSGGEASGARSNTVAWSGHGGISVAGGDHKTLVPGRNFADNNYVHHCARIWKTYRPAVTVSGVGNTVSHNVIHDMPHAGVTLSGNDNVMEFNVVHHVNLESTDTGGLYFCSRDWTQRGNVIRYNLFHHLGGFGKANSWAPVAGGKVKFEYPHFTWGIYLDDPTTGTHVYGNIVHSVPVCALHNHGGRDNVWENNILVDAPAFNAGMLSPNWNEWPDIYKRLNERRAPGSPYLERYPEIAKIADTRPEAMTGVVFRRNILYYTKEGTAWLRGKHAGGWGGEGSQLIYQLHFHKDDFDPASFDHNCLFLEEGLEPRIRFTLTPGAPPPHDLTWDEWQKTGADAHSVVADPLFADAAAHDYRLKKGSPALALGFKPIPVGQIGLYRDEFRREWPVREAPGATALGDFTAERYYEPPRFRRTKAEEINLRDGLGNFFAKAAAGKPLKVAYFGGGIHPDGTGWRGDLMKWLRDTVATRGPRVELSVEEIDAGICDCIRGAGFSAWRFAHDVLAYKPDLVLVDFAPALNEAQPDEIQRAMEGIVRQAWKADPTIDFLFLHAFADGYEKDYAEGFAPHAISAAEHIADHYGVASVDMACRIAQLCREGKLITKGSAEEAVKGKKLLFSTDGRRPTPEANRIYSEVITAALEQAAEDAKAAPHKLVAPFRHDNYERARQVPIAKAMLSGSWEELPAEDPLRKRFARHFDTIWYTKAPGAKLTFKFRGTEASLFDLMGPDTGRVRVSVDGKEVGIRQQVDPWAYYQRLAGMPLASGLPDAEHTIVVELLPDAPDRKVAMESATRAKQFDPKLFEGVALRLGFIRIFGEPVD